MGKSSPIIVHEMYSIRKVTTIEEAQKISKLMINIWEMSDLEAVATFEMRAVADFGTVLMAYENQNPSEPIGYIYAFPNFDEHHYKHYSHMMGIAKEWQSHGVGYNLKLAHRTVALESKPRIYSIDWTVDPLLPNNATLNFSKLGAICRSYKVNYYGDPNDVGIYAGVPTDRFYVEWVLDSQWVNKKLSSKHSPKRYEEVIESNTVYSIAKHNKFKKVLSQYPDDEFLVEVPGNYQAIRIGDTSLALDWRLKFREICMDMFGNGWAAIDYITSKDQSNNYRNFYKFAPLNEDNIKRHFN